MESLARFGSVHSGSCSGRFWFIPASVPEISASVSFQFSFRFRFRFVSYFFGLLELPESQEISKFRNFGNSEEVSDAAGMAVNCRWIATGCHWDGIGLSLDATGISLELHVPGAKFTWS